MFSGRRFRVQKPNLEVFFESDNEEKRVKLDFSGSEGSGNEGKAGEGLENSQKVSQGS